MQGFFRRLFRFLPFKEKPVPLKHYLIGDRILQTTRKRLNR